MNLESSIFPTNRSHEEITLHLEPWGDQFKMLPGATLCLIAKAEQQGSFKIEYLDSEIIVWAWPTAVVKVFNEGHEVIGDYERTPVPAVPEGMDVASFLRLILGKD